MGLFVDADLATQLWARPHSGGFTPLHIPGRSGLEETGPQNCCRSSSAALLQHDQVLMSHGAASSEY